MAKQYEIRELDLDLIDPNPWNPNEQSESTFDILAEELDDDGDGVGYIDLIQVVPWGEPGRFRIIGGEHRWRALRVNGEETADALVLIDEKWQDEDLQKFVTMRLNSLKGSINPAKFMALYNDLADRHSADDMQRHMAVTDDDAWHLMTKDVRKQLESALDGAGGDDAKKQKALEEFDKVAKEVKTVDDLSNVLNKIFNEYGDTLDSNFMWFTFGGKKHLHLTMEASDWKAAEALISIVKKNGLQADKVFGNLMSDWVAKNK